jgi:hypothetical protein
MTNNDQKIFSLKFSEFQYTTEREFLKRRLIANNWNKQKTAKELGIMRSHIYNLISTYKLEKSEETDPYFLDAIFTPDRPVLFEPDLTNEIWKIYPKNSDYLVSDKGRIKNVKGEIMNQSCANIYSYPAISIKDLDKNKFVTKYVYRIVAETFIPNPDNKKEVNHKNRIKTDSRAINLEWVTPSENVIHSKNSEIGEMNSAGIFSA